MAKQYVVIGVSAAGIGCLSKLRQLDSDATIIALSDEKDFPYNKCFLVDYLSGAKTQEQIFTKAATFFTDNRIDLRLGTKVTSINRLEKTVSCHDSTVVVYDALLVATGGSARILHVAGSEGIAGIFPLYTYSQADTCKTWAQRLGTKNIVVVGAGLSGLECADALLAYNKSIMVIDVAGRPLPHHTTHEAGSYLASAMENAGITFMPQAGITAVTSKQGVIVAVTLSSGESYPADMLVWAIGAQPNLTLAIDAGLATAHHAIVTNQYLQTTDPSIFTAGDCALVMHAVTQESIRSTTWPDAMMQGMVAAAGMVGTPRVYPGLVPFLSSAFFGQKFYAAGMLQPLAGDRVIEKITSDAYIYVIITDGGVVRGFNLVGAIVTLYSVELKRSLMSKSVYQGVLISVQ